MPPPERCYPIPLSRNGPQNLVFGFEPGRFGQRLRLPAKVVKPIQDKPLSEDLAGGVFGRALLATGYLTESLRKLIGQVNRQRRHTRHDTPRRQPGQATSVGLGGQEGARHTQVIGVTEGVVGYGDEVLPISAVSVVPVAGM